MPAKKRIEKQPALNRSIAEKHQSISCDEIQGRAGEALPARETTLVGAKQEWVRDNYPVQNETKAVQ
jgi:hypothetical protein